MTSDIVLKHFINKMNGATDVAGDAAGPGRLVMLALLAVVDMLGGAGGWCWQRGGHVVEAWRKHGGSMAEAWQKHGRSMAEAWQKHGGSMAQALQKHGGRAAEAWLNPRAQKA